MGNSLESRSVARGEAGLSVGRRALMGLMSTLPLPALAQGPTARTWPDRPVRLLVGFAPGGVADVSARLLADSWRESFGQPFVVENRPGGSSTLAAAMVARAPADGHTLLVASNALFVAPALMRQLPYDTLKDLRPITRFAAAPNLLVVPSASPFRNLGDFVDAARSRPQGQEATYAVSGLGTPTHLTAGMLAEAAGIRLTSVPYRSSAEAAQAVVAGQVQAGISSVNAVLPLLQGAQMRALAVSAAERNAFVPDIPTFAEGGLPKVVCETWVGILAPAGTPDDIVERLHASTAAMTGQPNARQVLEAQGAVPVVRGPDEMMKAMTREVREFGQLARTMGLEAQ